MSKKKKSLKTKLQAPEPKSEFTKLINSKINKSKKRMQKRKELLPKKRDISLKNGVKISSKNIIPSFLRKRKKRDLFALGSSDEEFGFTHNGRDIEEMDGKEINEYRGLDEDKLSGNPNHIDTDIVNKLNFSGFQEDNDDGKKTRKEVYEDIIKRSKIRKMEAQREQEENVQLGKELDEKFDDLFKELTMKPKKKLKTSSGSEELDEYNAITRQMMFEPKLKAIVVINQEKRVQREKEKRKKIAENIEEDYKEFNDFFEYDDGIDYDTKERSKSLISRIDSEMNHKTQKLINNFHKTIDNLKTAAEREEGEEEAQEDILDEIDFDAESDDELSEEDL